MHIRFPAFTVAVPLLTALLAARPANAVDFSWTGFDDEQYFNYLNWLPFDPGAITGPPTTSDTATIENGDSVFVNQDFTSAWRIDGLTLSGGSKLYNVPSLSFFPPAGYTIFVDEVGSSANAVAELSGTGTELIVYPHHNGTGTNGLDADLLAVDSGATVSLAGGRMEVDSLPSNIDLSSSAATMFINPGAQLRGYGWVDLEPSKSTPFKVLRNDGLIRAYGYGSAGTPQVMLTLNVTSSNGRIDLDGTTGDGAVQIDANASLIMNAPLNDAFDGHISMSRNSVFQISADWTNNTDGVIDINAGTGTATIRGGATPNVFTNNGTINVNSGTLVMASNYVDHGSTIHLAGGGLRLLGDATIDNPDFGGAYQLTLESGSHTTINATAFDWDGNGNAKTAVKENAALLINADSVDLLNNTHNGHLELQGGAAIVQLPASGDWTSAGTITALASDVASRIDGSPLRVTGTVNVAPGATLEFDADTTFAAGYQLTRGANSTLSFNGDSLFEGDVDLDGPDDDLIVTVGEGKTLTLSGAVNDDPLRPDVFGGKLRLEGGTVDVLPTGIDPLMIYGDPTKEPPSIVFKQVSDHVPAFVAIELLHKRGKIQLEGTGQGRLDTKVTTTPDASIDAGAGNVIFEQELSVDGGQFIGKQATVKGGLRVIGDTAIDIELLDMTNQSIVVEAGKTLTINSAAFNTEPSKQRELGGAQFAISGVVDLADPNGDISFNEGPDGSPGQVIFDQVADNMPTLHAYSDFVAWKTNFGTATGIGRIETPRFWLSFYGECSGNLLIKADETTIEGRISPGNSPGTIEVTGDYEQTAISHLYMELAGVTPGSEYDQLIIGGQATLGGTLDVALIDGFKPSAGDVFNLLEWGNVVGQFDSVNLPPLTGNLMWDASSLFTSGQLAVLATGLPGDFDLDGDVDGEDFLIFQRGESPKSLDPSDLSDWKSHYGTASSLAKPAATVPEPSLPVLMEIACLLLLLGKGARRASNPASEANALRCKHKLVGDA